MNLSSLIAAALLLVAVLVPLVQSANILAVFPSVWRSHYLFGRAVLQQLAAQNYSVTLLSPHAAGWLDDDETNEWQNQTGSTTITRHRYDEQPLNRIREIKVNGLLENWLEMGLSFDIEEMHDKSILERFTRLIYAGTSNVDVLLSDAQVRKLLRSGEQFDLLMVDLFLNDALVGLGYFYQIPTVAVSPNGANGWLNEMMGNPQSYALDPSYFLPYAERMDFWQRSVNTIMGIFEKLTYYFFHVIAQQAIYDKHFQSLCHLAKLGLPHHRDLTQNLSLALINTNAVLQYPRAYLPNMLQLGGIHLHAAQQLSLPLHLQQFIESAAQGVVYISFGADARTVDLSKDKLEALLDVFSSLPKMHFLLKWELAEYNFDLPKNVMPNAWFPQQAILSHPNVKVFISSCGLMSSMEAIIGLTAILATPIYPDQVVNAKRLEKQGVALLLPYNEITYDALLYGIKMLTTAHSFGEKLQLTKSLMQSDYGKSSERLEHYIELVLNKPDGAHYLKSHARNHLNYLRSELWDVTAAISLGLALIVAIPFTLTACILRRSHQRDKQTQMYRSRILVHGKDVAQSNLPLKRSQSYGGQIGAVCGLESPMRRSASNCMTASTSSSGSYTSSSSSGAETDSLAGGDVPAPHCHVQQLRFND